MSDSIDADLEWLIDDDTSSDQEEAKEPVKSDPVPEKEGATGGDATESDTDHEDDGLTPEEREILQHNTLLNDAEDREDYDLKDKVQKANADLEKISNVDGSREVKVMFKKKLVDVEAPPLEYSSDSSSSSSSDSEDDEKSRPKSPERSKSPPTADVKAYEKEEDSKEKILIEKGGKFQLVNANQGISTRDQQSTLNSSYSSTYNIKHTTGKTLPPLAKSQSMVSRPSSAPISSTPRFNGNSTTTRPGSATRSYDARARPDSRSSEYDHIRSPYAMSPEMKELMHKRAEARAAREEEERLQRQQRQKEAQQNAEYAWKCWVEKKDNEIRERKKLEEEREKKNAPNYDSKKEAEEAYEAWLREKRQQRRKDRLLEQQRQMEVEEGWYRRDRKECDKAYKQWLHKKREESRREQLSRARLGQKSRADAFRMRKIRRLLMSIESSQRLSFS